MSWYCGNFPENDIVISTRIRLARNIAGLPFPSKMNEEQRAELCAKVKKALAESNDSIAQSLKYIDMKDVPVEERYAMVERHIISPDFIADTHTRAILISPDECICVMVGEEDHIRIQVLSGGLQPEKAYETAHALDRLLGEQLPFAFDERLGYLTECPTNLGTGMRVSVMLHLPLTESRHHIGALADSVSKVGFTVRGMYGENSKAAASLYQISNQITLGLSEEKLLENVKALAMQLVERERNERKANDTVALQDRCLRAFGVLSQARLVSSEEMMKLLSRIKLGQSMGYLPETIETVRLLVEGQPNMIARKCGPVSPQERDIHRATLLREALATR
ncbi:MAG: protein arginine kinase [Clostridia bacterium]|nr:protein arginine kinase [Clostridia bacterium]